MFGPKIFGQNKFFGPEKYRSKMLLVQNLVGPKSVGPKSVGPKSVGPNRFRGVVFSFPTLFQASSIFLVFRSSSFFVSSSFFSSSSFIGWDTS